VARPSSINSQEVIIDNSTGSSDLVQALFSSSTPSRSAVIHRDPNDTGAAYIGGSAAQAFPFNPGDVVETNIDDLSKVYVKVAAGAKATIYVLWEA
jgi:hypothetical protein